MPNDLAHIFEVVDEVMNQFTLLMAPETLTAGRPNEWPPVLCARAVADFVQHALKRSHQSTTEMPTTLPATSVCATVCPPGEAALLLAYFEAWVHHAPVPEQSSRTCPKAA